MHYNRTPEFKEIQGCGIHIVLVMPEIAPNTGNIIRLCANTGARLHLVEPLGFSLEERLLRRASLDYRDLAHITTHPSLDSCLSSMHGRKFAMTASAQQAHHEIQYQQDDALFFGPESTGLSPEVLSMFPEDRMLRIPMMPANRSLNLSNAVAIVSYEAWRQMNFHGSDTKNHVGK